MCLSGRFKWVCYQPNKPNRFSIKLYQVCEASSGYIIGFEVYSGKHGYTASASADVLDKECTSTTRLVVGLLDQLELLDKGYCIWMDNYYNSPELMEELVYRSTWACGTLRSNRKGIPASVKAAKLKPGETVFRRNGPTLILKWCDKRMVTMITTIHEACEVQTKRKDAHGNRITKPQCVVEYCQNMAGVDLAGQYLSNYNFLRKSNKWTTKLFFHMFSMVLLNAYILNKKFGNNKLSHEGFRQHMAQYLLSSSTQSTCTPQRRKYRHTESCDRLVGRHFPEFITAKAGHKRGKLSRNCYACNMTQRELVSLGRGHLQEPKRKTTSYQCATCNVSLCIVPCFQLYHTEKNYKVAILDAMHM